MGFNISREVAGMMARGAVAREPWDTMETRAVASDAMGRGTGSHSADPVSTYGESIRKGFMLDLLLIRPMSAFLTGVFAVCGVFYVGVVAVIRDGFLRQPAGMAAAGVLLGSAALGSLAFTAFFGTIAFTPAGCENRYIAGALGAYAPVAHTSASMRAPLMFRE